MLWFTIKEVTVMKKNISSFNMVYNDILCTYIYYVYFRNKKVILLYKQNIIMKREQEMYILCIIK